MRYAARLPPRCIALLMGRFTCALAQVSESRVGSADRVPEECSGASRKTEREHARSVHNCHTALAPGPVLPICAGAGLIRTVWPLKPGALLLGQRYVDAARRRGQACALRGGDAFNDYTVLIA